MGTQVEPVCLQILTPLTLKSRDAGEKLLQLWESCLPECLPDKIGNWEAVDRIFDLSKRDLILDHWQDPFLAVKKKPKMDAYVGMRPEKRPLHASLRFTLRFGQVDVPKLENFLQAITREFKADFGC